MGKRTRSQAGKMAKRKGNAYENKVAKMFTKWLGHPFRRVPSSGGWDKLAGDGKKVAPGDIYCSDPDYHFCHVVECKNRERSWDFGRLLTGKCKPFWDWWDQVCGDAEPFVPHEQEGSWSLGRSPMLVFTKNGEEDFVAVEYESFPCEKDLPSEYQVVSRANEKLVIFSWKHLIKYRPESLCDYEKPYTGLFLPPEKDSSFS